MVHGAKLCVSGTADLSRPSEAKAQEASRRGWDTHNIGWGVVKQHPKRTMVGEQQHRNK